LTVYIKWEFGSVRKSSGWHINAELFQLSNHNDEQLDGHIFKRSLSCPPVNSVMTPSWYKQLWSIRSTIIILSAPVCFLPVPVFYHSPVSLHLH